MRPASNSVAGECQGISTTAWTSSQGMDAFLSFFGNELLCLVGISLLGMLVAVLTRSTGAAVGIALAYVLVPEGLIAMVWRGGGGGLPVRVFNYFTGANLTRPPPPPGYKVGLL